MSIAIWFFLKSSSWQSLPVGNTHKMGNTHKNYSNHNRRP